MSCRCRSITRCKTTIRVLERAAKQAGRLHSSNERVSVLLRETGELAAAGFTAVNTEELAGASRRKNETALRYSGSTSEQISREIVRLHSLLEDYLYEDDYYHSQDDED